MIIGIMGKKQSGKNTTANYLKEQLSIAARMRVIDYHPESIQVKMFANRLKSMAAQFLGVHKSNFEIESFKAKELPEVYQNKEKGIITYRDFLQKFGTEIMKPWFGDDVWARVELEKFEAITETATNTGRDQRKNLWIFTDCRFKTEWKAIKDRDGIIIKVDRDIQTQDSHSSETEMDELLYNYYIDNTKNLANLYTQVSEVSNNIIETINKTKN